jgi:Glutamine synthetase, catalytic domain
VVEVASLGSVLDKRLDRRRVIERTWAWLHSFECLHGRHKRRAAIHQALPSGVAQPCLLDHLPVHPEELKLKRSLNSGETPMTHPRYGRTTRATSREWSGQSWCFGYALEPHELLAIPTAPGSLEEVPAALEEDHRFLLRGDVFTEDLIRTWISYKREYEIAPVRLHPHPYEFFLYYDG